MHASAQAPRRVLLALGTSGPGGAEQMLLQLACALRERGAAPALATFAPGWMTERAQRLGLPVWIAPQRRGSDPLWIARFAGRLRREGIELLHTHEFEMNVYGAAAAWLARVPSLATLHGLEWGLARRRHLLAYRALYRDPSRLVAVSHDLARSVAPRLGRAAESFPVVHNGIPLPALPPAAERAALRAAARAELGLPQAGPLLVAVGNLYPVKDHATLVRALPALAQARLAIAGRGQEEEPLRRLAAELGVADRLHLLGLRDDVERVLRAADVFVQPSRSEGLPLAVLEAMAAALPIVATRVGGVGEAVIDGQSGLLVPPEDPSALAGAVGRILGSADRGAGFGREARARAEREFSLEAMARRYAELYAALCGAPAARAHS
jgi:glycosyltransferase involved in cell wall biosynthesis